MAKCRECLEHLEEASIGTIHSFCAQILRERPVEAVVDPAFEELTERQAYRIFSHAFRDWFQEKLNETSPALRALITLVLVEATTGLVLGLRTVSYSPEFTRASHRAIHGQVVAPFDPDTHGQWADGMLQFTTEQLWDKTTVRCRGDE